MKIHNKQFGCKGNATNSIDKAFEKHEKLIILEDDISLAKNFLFIQKLLKLYKNYDKVNMISGYNYLTKSKISNDFFTLYKYGGWAT